MALAVVVNVVPPAQAHHQAASDVFYSPKVERKEQHNEHKTSNETAAEPAAQQVGDQRGASEPQMRERHVRVPEKRDNERK